MKTNGVDLFQFKMFGKGLLTVGLITVLGLALLPSGAFADNSTNNFHWERTANPFTLTLVSRLTSEWTPYLKKASKDWAKSSVLGWKILTLPSRMSGVR